MSHRTKPLRYVLLLVAVAALLAYGAGLAGEYVFDDVHSVQANPAVHDLGNLVRFWHDPGAFSAGGGRMYRPALMTSLALNWAICADAWSLKLGNLLLHAANAVLLTAWLWRLGRHLRFAAVVGCWFAAHPLLSEAVNLVSARSELLCGTGVLLGMLAHANWQRRGGVGSWLLLPFTVVLACGSKETGVMLPLLFALQAWWLRPVGSSLPWQRTIVGLLPTAAVVAGYLVARKLLLGDVTVALAGRVDGDILEGYGRSLSTQLATMGGVLPQALWQVVWPWPLSLDPAVTFRTSFFDPVAAGGWLLLIALTAALVWPGRGSRLRRLGAAMAWLTALPWIVVPLNMPLAEHRLYLPTAGVAAVAVSLIPVVARWAAAWRPHAMHIAAAASALLWLPWAATSALHSFRYREPRLLWEHELANHPESFQANWGLGMARMRHGDYSGAEAPLAVALRLRPNHITLLTDYASHLVEAPPSKRSPQRALAIAERLVAICPDEPWERTLLVRAELLMGEATGEQHWFERAEARALSCLEIGSPKGYVYQLAAKARQMRGDREGALQHLDTSVSRGLCSVGVRLDRAALLRELGRPAEAQRELLLAQRQEPWNPAVMQALQQPAGPGR